MRTGEEDRAGLAELQRHDALDQAGSAAVVDAQATPGEGADAAVDGVAADRVVDDVDAAALRDAQRFLAEVVLAVEDDVVGAERPSALGLLRRTDGGDHRGAAQPGELHQQTADAAGRGMHQAGRAFLQLEGRMGEVVGRQSLQHQRRGRTEVQRVGHAHELGGRDDRVFREAAADDAPRDAVADRQPGDTGAQRRDPAGTLHAERHRQRIAVGVGLGVAAEPEMDVDEVETGDLEPDEGLAGARLRHVDRLEPADAGVAVLVDADGLHGAQAATTLRSRNQPSGISCASGSLCS